MKSNIVHLQEEMSPEETAAEMAKKSTGRLQAGKDVLLLAGALLLSAVWKKTEDGSGKSEQKSRKS